jgi:hypothetical protein
MTASPNLDRFCVKSHDINSGKPWSELDLRDLHYCLEAGEHVEDIANFLCRDVEDGRTKTAEIAARGES